MTKKFTEIIKEAKKKTVNDLVKDFKQEFKKFKVISDSDMERGSVKDFGLKKTPRFNDIMKFSQMRGFAYLGKRDVSDIYYFHIVTNNGEYDKWYSIIFQFNKDDNTINRVTISDYKGKV